MSPENHDPEIAALEAALASLAPAAVQINRDRLMFRAGQASLPRQRWLWPCAAVALALVAASLGADLVMRPTPRPVERIVYVPVKEPAPSAPAAPAAPAPSKVPRSQALSAEENENLQGDANYLRLRDLVIDQGVDALPRPPLGYASAQPAPIDKLIDLPPGTLDTTTLQRLQRSLESGGPL